MTDTMNCSGKDGGEPGRLWSYIVLGGGPAGLQLSYYLERAGLDHLVLERSTAGAFFEQFPRHRMLISSNKVHTGYSDPELQMRFDWNSLLTDDYSLLFRDYSKRYFADAGDLVRYLGDFAKKYTPQLRTGVDIRTVTRAGGGEFVLTDAGGTSYRARRLVVATGGARAYVPEIPGIELAESYVDVDVDPESFAGQRVLVLGKGNSGFETANNLVETASIIHVASPHPVKFAWATHYPGHLRAVNNNFLDTYQLKTQNAVLDAAIEGIAREPDGRLRVQLRYAHASGEVEALVYDRVIVCTGFGLDASIFDASCRPALTINDRFPAQTSAWESVNVEGLYFAGMLTQPRDFKKTNSAFIHGFRYNTRALFRILKQRHHQAPWPAEPVSPTVEGLADAVLARVNSSSALWQQFGFLGDVITLEADRARLCPEMPVQFIQDSVLAEEQECFVVTLEFGEHRPDPFAVVRNPDPNFASESFFLHPVIRHYRGKALVGALHLLEDLFGEWKSEEKHRKPLLAFFAQQLPMTIPPMHQSVGAAVEVMA